MQSETRPVIGPETLRSRTVEVLLLAFVLLVSSSLVMTASVSAAAPDFLWKTPPGDIGPDSSAGQLNNPRGMVADPDTGHLYVAEFNNARVSEFTAWGAFVKAWGWNVAPEGATGDTPSDQLEVCTTTCQAGVSGGGAGQFNWPTGITLDTAGDLYVYDAANNRVQKFSPSGEFILTFGGLVNKTAVQEREEQETNSEPVTVTPQEENLCAAVSADICDAGVSGAADGYFSTESRGNYLAFNPQTGTLFAGDKDRVQEFNTNGVFEGKIDFDGSLGALDGKTVQALTVDPVSGELSFTVHMGASVSPVVYKLDAQSQELVNELSLPVDVHNFISALALAVDAARNLYVVWSPFESQGKLGERVLGFDSNGAPISGMGSAERFGQASTASVDITGLATNVLGPGSSEPGNLYINYFESNKVSHTDAYGPSPIAFEDPPLAVPEIAAQYASEVGTDAATLGAQINPHFWDDATYYVQYGTEPCELGGCAVKPAPPGTPLTSKSVDAAIASKGVLLTGLQSDTTYHYRFVAQSDGSEGEEVVGVGGAPGAPGAEGAFTTFPLPVEPETDCPNQSFRRGAAARLPDCRAYEMVSPLEKNNNDIQVPIAAFPRGLNQSSGTGEKLTYSSATAFGETESAPYSSQYLAHRDPVQGWWSEAISPPQAKKVPTGAAAVLEADYKLFSPDLCRAWIGTATDPPLTSTAAPGYRNLYRRENCDGGDYDALITAAPPHYPPGQNVPTFGLELQGASVDGERAIFAADDNLPNDLPGPAAPTNANERPQLYEHVRGQGLRFVCVLPNGSPTSQSCSAGTQNSGLGEGQSGNFHNAISADGTRIFWSAATAPPAPPGPGRIYARIDGEETREVSKAAEGISGTTSSRFWGASEKGDRAIFTSGNLEGGKADLYSFDVEEATTTQVANGVMGLLGTSEDATRVYFASIEVLGGANSEDDVGQPGSPNLYLWEEGVGISFIGTLAAPDAGSAAMFVGTNPYPISPFPSNRIARVSPDGAHAVFTSAASLTDYDNVDLESDKPALEVFLYDAQEEELRCVSCNPTGARPEAGDISRVGPPLPAAAHIPTAQNALYASRVLSDDGSRLYFESFEALLPTDTNGVQDVYQWEKEGSGSCAAGDSTFNPDSGGCVELISSGESPRNSTFVDADPEGENVFISTLSSLVPQDFGLIDIYDARVGGGFAQPAATPGCEGEACQGPLSAPDDPTPASSAFEGAGNVVEPPPARKCAKGRRAVRKAGRTRCVKKPQTKSKGKKAKRANAKRRAGR